MRAMILILALAGPACALTVDEVVQLSEAGLADDIILDQMKADGSAFELSAAEIIHLQRKKVSPVVIRFMVSARERQAPPEAAPIPANEPRKPAEIDDSVLTVRNLSKGIVSVMMNPGEREMVLVHGEIEGVTVLRNGSHADLGLPSGLYRIRWTNEEPFRELAVASNVTTEIEFRDDDRFLQGVRVVAILDGKEEADPWAAPATEDSGTEAEAAEEGSGEVVVVYEEAGEPVWDGHAFIEVASHVHGDRCGHWYYDNCWNLHPRDHVYTQLGYSRCGDTGGFYHSGESYARVWDGWVFSFLRAHIHGVGCGHFYHHGCWNIFPHHHIFREHGRGHFNPCPPRRRVPVHSMHGRSDASRTERSSGASAPGRHSESPVQRASEPARRGSSERAAQPGRRQEPARVVQPQGRQEPQRAQPPARRQEPQRAQPPARRQEPQRAQPPARRQEPQRVEPPARRPEPQRVERPARRPEPQRVERPARRQEPQQVERPARRQEPQRAESPQSRSSPRQRQPENNGRGKRR